MTHRIDDLPFHLALRAWMTRRFGESCASAEILMVQSLAYVWCIYAYDLKERHMQVERKVAKISQVVRRPQRVPTFRKYRALAEFFERQFEALDCNFGARLVSTSASKAMGDKIVAHERRTELAQIDEAHAG